MARAPKPKKPLGPNAYNLAVASMDGTLSGSDIHLGRLCEAYTDLRGRIAVVKKADEIVGALTDSIIKELDELDELYLSRFEEAWKIRKKMAEISAHVSANRA